MPWTVNPDHGYLEKYTTAGSIGALTNIDVDTSTPPGTDPVVPNGVDNITFTGAQVASGAIGANVLRTNSLAANTVTYEIQQSGSSAAQDTTLNGAAHFNSSHFSVSNGFVSLAGGGQGIDSFSTDVSGPVSADASGNVAVSGATNIFSDGSVANTLRLNLQGTNHALYVGRGANTASTSLAVGTNGQVLIAATTADPAFATLTSSDSSITFTTGANTLSLQVAGGATVGKTITGNSGGALSPSAGNWNIFGASTAAGTSPVTTSGSGSTLTVNVQKSQAIAATDATKIGLCNFDSSDFTVDSNGFVTLNASGAGQTITGDSGGALNPSGGNWNILGLSGAKTSGSGSTITIKTPPYSDIGGSGTGVKNTGEFITATCTRTLPVSAGLADGDLFEFAIVGSAVLTIQAVGSQKIRVGAYTGLAAGSLFNLANDGDAVTLRFRSTDETFYATSIIGNWQLL